MRFKRKGVLGLLSLIERNIRFFIKNIIIGGRDKGIIIIIMGKRGKEWKKRKSVRFCIRAKLCVELILRIRIYKKLWII